jgi:hypothetical protein
MEASSGKTNSNLQGLPLVERAREWLQFSAMRLRGIARREDYSWLWGNLEEYARLLQKYSGKALVDADVFEIGFGARPYRLMALCSLGVNARGVDLDQPVLRGSMREFSAILRQNGWERWLKSVVRFHVFDWKQRRDLRRSLRGRKRELVVDPVRFLVGDAAGDDLDRQVVPQSLDLIYSEDVFEHVPADSLPKLVQNMARWLRAHGLALIRPNIFTGITGSHLLEWYGHRVGDMAPRRSEPWEHLRKKRFTANTFLNGLTRADYRRIFSAHFDIRDEVVASPDLGRAWLTPTVRAELSAYSEEELFSNNVLFVLTPKG